jgi:hypothetical protein
MEKLFAVLGGPNENIVINTIVCDSKEIAEEVTRMTCIEISADTPVSIDKDKWDGTSFVPVTPEDLITPDKSIK